MGTASARCQAAAVEGLSQHCRRCRSWCAVHATAVLFAAAEDPVAVESVASPLRELVTAVLPSVLWICFVAELSYGFEFQQIVDIGKTLPLFKELQTLGAIFCLIALCFKSLSGFIVLFSIGELLIFATQAPVNYVSLHCVKPILRALSMAISTISIHIFGDVPSSPLVGILQDHIND
ncbi:hypothetical protein S83_066699 [Arachis hypogaea]